MIIVIQCAARKRENAGRLCTSCGKPVMFVAVPAKAPPNQEYLYARPDDPSDSGDTWRQLLLRHNQRPQDNPFGLTRAYELYQHPVYRRLVERYGTEKTYILSAGWGLIGAEFLTHDYDITFSASAEAYKRRRKSDVYSDLRMIPTGDTESVVFFGGKDYIPLFCGLTADTNGTRTIFYNSATAPEAPGCSLERYNTTTRTNWHYECAGAFLDGRITVAG